MGKDYGSWIYQQCPPHEAPNLNCTSLVPDSTWPSASPDCTKPTCLASTESILGHTGPKLPQYKAGQASGPQGWFYGLPRYRQALTPIPDFVPKGINAYPEVDKRDAALNAIPKPNEKKFLVFDHSGNQTRLIYSPCPAYPNQCSNIGTLRALDSPGLGREAWTHKTSPLYGAAPLCPGGHEVEDEGNEESEMHEDTDELNALLYSDGDEDDCGYECEEEISTGHSPSKARQENRSEEEVATSGGGHLKRKRSLKEECKTSSLMDTASSGKPNGLWECEEDAESSCGESTTDGGESGSLLFNKRRDKIYETVNILQNIIPGGKGKDAMLVLDEAIQYLRSLKLKAKSLGEGLE